MKSRKSEFYFAHLHLELNQNSKCLHMQVQNISLNVYFIIKYFIIIHYLLYLIYQHHNGSLSKENFTKCKKDLHEFLIKKSAEKEHFVEYLEHWDFKLNH